MYDSRSFDAARGLGQLFAGHALLTKTHESSDLID